MLVISEDCVIYNANKATNEPKTYYNQVNSQGRFPWKPSQTEINKWLTETKSNYRLKQIVGNWEKRVKPLYLTMKKNSEKDILIWVEKLHKIYSTVLIRTVYKCNTARIHQNIIYNHSFKKIKWNIYKVCLMVFLWQHRFNTLAEGFL